jgi:hypothetical protein
METTKNTKKRNKNVYKKKTEQKKKRSREISSHQRSVWTMEYVVFFNPNVVKDWKHKELKTDLKKQATHARKKRKRSMK